jgi:uncharacterized membrane protein YhaH (DUF805 family)
MSDAKVETMSGWFVCLFGLVVGLLVCWFVGLLVCWFVGLLVVGYCQKQQHKNTKTQKKHTKKTHTQSIGKSR